MYHYYYCTLHGRWLFIIINVFNHRLFLGKANLYAVLPWWRLFQQTSLRMERHSLMQSVNYCTLSIMWTSYYVGPSTAHLGPACGLGRHSHANARTHARKRRTVGRAGVTCVRRSMSEREERETSSKLLWSTLCASVARSQHLPSDTDFVLPRLSEGALLNTASSMIQLKLSLVTAPLYILFNKSVISMLYFNCRIDLLDSTAYTVELNKWSDFL